MQLEIYGKDIPLSEPLRKHIERRLRFALERFAGRIRRVRVSVGDLNGPRGGVDKRCRVAIVLRPSTTIVMEDLDSKPIRGYWPRRRQGRTVYRTAAQATSRS